MSAHHSKMRILLGQVIGTKMKKTAKVRVERLVLDKYVMEYHPKKTTVFAHDGQEEAKEGDVVLVRQLPLPRSKHVKYGLDRIVYSLGNVTDPLTGKKCDGFSYWDGDTSAAGKVIKTDSLEGVDVGQSVDRDSEVDRESEGTPV